MADPVSDSKSLREPFLPEHHGDDTASVVISPANEHWQFFNSYRSIGTHAFLILIYTVATFAIIHRNTSQSAQKHDLIPSPARHALEYERKIFDLAPATSEYAGAPRPELEKAWHDLLVPINIPVSAVDLSALNITSVVLPHQAGYLGQLGVYHELHCIKVIRQWLRRSHYHPDVSKAEEGSWSFHAEHCLELFRESAMCRGDISLTTFGWDKGESRPGAMFESPHDCVNWDKLVSWSRERYLDSAAMAKLINPL